MNNNLIENNLVVFKTMPFNRDFFFQHSNLRKPVKTFILKIIILFIKNFRTPYTIKSKAI